MCSVRDGCQLTIPARPVAAFRVGEVLKRVVAGRTSASLSPVRSVPLAPHTIHPCGHRSVCHFTAIRSTTRHVARTYGYHLHVHPASPAAQSPVRTPRPATTAHADECAQLWAQTSCLTTHPATAPGDDPSRQVMAALRAADQAGDVHCQRLVHERLAAS